MQLLAPAAAEKGLDLVLLIDPAVPALVVGDVTRLRQVLINLIGNAVKFTEQGEVVIAVDVEASAEPAAIRLHVAVTDTGIGIPAEQARPAVSAVRPGRQLDDAPVRRHRPRAGHQPASRRDHGRRYPGGKRRQPGGSTFHLRVTHGQGPRRGAAVDAGRAGAARQARADGRRQRRRSAGPSSQFTQRVGHAVTETDSLARPQPRSAQRRCPTTCSSSISSLLMDGVARQPARRARCLAPPARPSCCSVESARATTTMTATRRDRMRHHAAASGAAVEGHHRRPRRRRRGGQAAPPVAAGSARRSPIDCRCGCCSPTTTWSTRRSARAC